MPEKTIGRDQVWVPWAFYKIIVFREHGQLQALAFQYKNQEETNDFYTHETTINNVQSETGLDFLNTLSKDEEEKIDKQKINEKDLNDILSEVK